MKIRGSVLLEGSSMVVPNAKIQSVSATFRYFSAGQTPKLKVIPRVSVRARLIYSIGEEMMHLELILID